MRSDAAVEQQATEPRPNRPRELDLIGREGLGDENGTTGVGDVRNAAENLLRGVQVDWVDGPLAKRLLEMKKVKRTHFANGRLLSDRSAENTVATGIQVGGTRRHLLPVGHVERVLTSEPRLLRLLCNSRLSSACGACALGIGLVRVANDEGELGVPGRLDVGRLHVVGPRNGEVELHQKERGSLRGFLQRSDTGRRGSGCGRDSLSP